jgi:hypothetical protein
MIIFKPKKMIKWVLSAGVAAGGGCEMSMAMSALKLHVCRSKKGERLVVTKKCLLLSGVYASVILCLLDPLQMPFVKLSHLHRTAPKDPRLTSDLILILCQLAVGLWCVSAMHDCQGAEYLLILLSSGHLLAASTVHLNVVPVPQAAPAIPL